MAAYDGVTVRIKVVVTDFDKVAVVPSEVTTAKVSLYDDQNDYVFLDENLTYSETHSYWYFDWQDALPGSFKAICSFTGPTYNTFEYATIRVKALKFVPNDSVPTSITN